MPRALAILAFLAALPAAANAQVVISQVYGGAGSNQALFQGDYVELFNRGTTPVSISGWSIQYASASGNFGQSILSVALPDATIEPGRYFLVKTYSPNTAFGAAVPADFVAPGPVQGQGVGVNLSNANGKVALLNTTDLLAALPCVQVGDERVVDLVGYGSANCSETNPSPPITIQTAAFRANQGCQDTGNNAADFGVTTPSPRSSATPAVPSCGTSVNPSGTGQAAPVPACPGLSVSLTFSVVPGENPPSTGVVVTGDFTALGGGPGNVFAAQGQNVFTASTIISPTVNTPRTFSVPIAITDAQGRTGLGSVSVEVVDCALRGSATASPSGVCSGEATTLRVVVTPGLQPDSTGVAVVGDLTAIGGVAGTALLDDGVGADAVAGDNVFSVSAVVAPGVTPAVSALPVTISDAQGRSAGVSISLAHGTCPDSQADVVISQVYGGGGGPGSLYRQDFIELFNRTAAPIDLSGWSIQYAGTTGEFEVGQVSTLFGTIPAHGYYLVGAIFGAGGTQDLPTIDDFASSNLFPFNGKVALVRNDSAIGADCADPDVADLVSYGPGVTCFDGLAAAPELSNTLAGIRKGEGCQDSNQNALDFIAAVPTPRNSASPTRTCTLPPICPPDLNGDGNLDPDDLADYIACYFASPPCPQGDVNGDGTADPDDLADYIASYFAGC